MVWPAFIGPLCKRWNLFCTNVGAPLGLRLMILLRFLLLIFEGFCMLSGWGKETRLSSDNDLAKKYLSILAVGKTPSGCVLTRGDLLCLFVNYFLVITCFPFKTSHNKPRSDWSTLDSYPWVRDRSYANKLGRTTCVITQIEVNSPFIPFIFSMLCHVAVTALHRAPTAVPGGTAATRVGLQSSEPRC